MTLEKIGSIVAAVAVVVIPVLIQDHVLTGVAADVTSAIIGSFVIGVHIPGKTSVPPAKQPATLPAPVVSDI